MAYFQSEAPPSALFTNKHEQSTPHTEHELLSSYSPELKNWRFSDWENKSQKLYYLYVTMNGFTTSWFISLIYFNTYIFSIDTKVAIYLG